MKLRDFVVVGVCLAIAAVAAPVSNAQNCNSSQDAAVQCFVGYAVRTNLTALRYGMNMTQFKAYGVAVSKILQDQQDYLALAGIAGDWYFGRNTHGFLMVTNGGCRDGIDAGGVSPNMGAESTLAYLMSAISLSAAKPLELAWPASK